MMKESIQSQEGGNFLLNVRNLTVPFGLLLAERGLKKLIETNSKNTQKSTKPSKRTTTKTSAKKVKEEKSVGKKGK